MSLLGLFTGVLFGAALVAAGLTNPRGIIAMLRFRDLHLLKVLVTAIAIGVVGLAAFAALGIGHFDVKATHVVANALGGLLFGVGFALTGYCPGTALAGSAEGRPDAPFVVVGGLAGTAVFTAMYDGLVTRLLEPLSYGKLTLPGMLDVAPLVVALPLGVVAAIFVARWLRTSPPRVA